MSTDILADRHVVDAHGRGGKPVGWNSNPPTEARPPGRMRRQVTLSPQPAGLLVPVGPPVELPMKCRSSISHVCIRFAAQKREGEARDVCKRRMGIGGSGILPRGG